MKTKYTVLIAFFLLFFSSCAWEAVETARLGTPETRGLIQVEITENNGQGTDKMETVRIIVFSDPAATPKLEFNERFTKDDFTIDDPSGGKTASKLKIMLDVIKKSSGLSEKVIVAIVNEPNSLTPSLEAITTPAQLANLDLNMSSILNDNHTALKQDVLMPMNGAIWVNRYDYFETLEEAEREENIVRLGVSRVVARVDVYLVNGGTTTENITVSSGSKVRLSNTYTQSPFIYHQEGSHTLGRLQTVALADLEPPYEWTSSVALAVPPRDIEHPISADSVYVCSFYTPERTCIAAENADKLRIDLGVKIGSEGTKSGGIVLDKALNVEDGVISPLTVVGRNNSYRVTATIGVSGILGIVQDWNSENITQQL